MKKIVLTTAALIIAMTMVAFREGRPVDYSELPAPAREFIESRFSGWEVVVASREDGEYDVFFKGGNKMEFDRKGNWKEIECRTGSIPLAVLPAPISEHIGRVHPEAKVVEVKRERKRYEVKLDNRLELKFDRDNRFIGFD